VTSADWKHLYSIRGTALVDTDPSSGLTSTTLQLPGAYQLPAATSSGLPGGISPNGSWLVAQSFDGAATHFVIVGTAEMRVAHTANLTGRFNFDAISNDGERLYLIQYLNGREYYVRLFNVLASTLDENIVVDKSDGGQSMTGLRLSGIATPGGGWLFSMYVRESDNPFIHVLSLDGPFAFCLDLPGSGYASSNAERHWSIAMDRTGDSLYAINAATGVVAQIDNSQQFNPQIRRTANIAGGRPADVGSNAAVLSPDGRWLIAAGSSGVVWIDTTTLAVRMQALTSWHSWSLGLSPDGSEVYAVSESGQVAGLETATGRVISTFDTGVGRPMALIRVASA
jgi:WD40 repeat protein